MCHPLECQVPSGVLQILYILLGLPAFFLCMHKDPEAKDPAPLFPSALRSPPHALGRGAFSTHQGRLWTSWEKPTFNNEPGADLRALGRVWAGKNPGMRPWERIFNHKLAGYLDPESSPVPQKGALWIRLQGWGKRLNLDPAEGLAVPVSLSQVWNPSAPHPLLWKAGQKTPP